MPAGAGGAAAEPPLVVASARALMHKTLPVREFRLGLREYRLGQEIDLQRTLRLWVAHGYRPETVVEEPGTFSRRGGLIDVFPPEPASSRCASSCLATRSTACAPLTPPPSAPMQRIERFSLAPATEALPRLAPAVARQRGRLWT